MTRLISSLGRRILLKSTNNVLCATFSPYRSAPSYGLFLYNKSCRQINTNTKYVKFRTFCDNTFGLQDDASSNIELKDIELNIDDDKLMVNTTWLRDCCRCSQCTHQFSRQRLFTPKEMHRGMFCVIEVKLKNISSTEKHQQSLWPEYDNDKDILLVKWLDGHHSEYSLSWLKHVVALNPKRQLQLDQPPSRIVFKYPQDDYYCPTKTNTTSTEYWNVSGIEALLDEVSYHDLIDGFEFNNHVNSINANKLAGVSPRRLKALHTLSCKLVSLGLAKIIDVPQERNQVLKIARSLAYERPTGYGVVFDVVVEPSEEINLAYSSLEFDLHTDLPYRESSPGVQLLHCIRNSTEGGLSYFSDAFLAAHKLRTQEPKLFEVLLQFPVTFAVRDPYRDVKLRRRQPIITLDCEGKISEVQYSPFTLPPIGHRDDVKLFYLALDKFTQLLHAKENKYIAKMNPGDLFIFHNRRVLHGRSSYNATTSSRFLQGCYMDWDEIKCLDEKLRSHMTSGK